ncbi:hypothetical protein OV207_26750 [Corallococcus sp. BB11-1]|uniref:hypothetical protein n=1 Tax=Corallococcus sp. BB11-1 TaxID=2996783 RepID=UPI0010D43818|nr:hypothetical protein [Corallococcus sp. BB11-1]MCY1035074.1 hypothetical protein [Corallococcus sp. BB11-1]RYZ17305.1 MAG: hypothetical protein EOO70_02305 [Myxococcaceae bacterium]
MNATKKREFQTAFMIDDPALEKLDRILSEFGPRTYTISFTDGLTLECGDLQGLRQQTSDRGNPILEILISTSWQSQQRAAIRLRKPEKQEVSSIDYDMAGEEKDVFVLSGKLDQWIAARRPPYAYFARWELVPVVSFFGGTALLIMALAAFPASESAIQETKTAGKPSPLAEVAPLWGWLLATIGFIATWLRNRVMPVADFAIGDGVERSRRLGWWRNAVILATVLSVATSVLTSKLMQ